MENSLCKRIDEWVSSNDCSLSSLYDGGRDGGRNEQRHPRQLLQEPIDSHSSSLTLHLLFKRDKPTKKLLSLLKRVEDSPLGCLTFIKQSIMYSLSAPTPPVDLKELQFLLLKSKTTTKTTTKREKFEKRQKLFDISVYDNEKCLLQCFSFPQRKDILKEIFNDRLDCSFARYSNHLRSTSDHRPPKSVKDLHLLLRDVRTLRLQKRKDQIGIVGGGISGIVGINSNSSINSNKNNNQKNQKLKIFWRKDGELVEDNFSDIPVNGETITVIHGRDGVCTHYASVEQARDEHPYYDNNATTIKERLFSDHVRKGKKCRICSSSGGGSGSSSSGGPLPLKERACWVSVDDTKSPENPCYWCNDCFVRIHYDSSGGILTDSSSFYLFPI